MLNLLQVGKTGYPMLGFQLCLTSESCTGGNEVDAIPRHGAALIGAEGCATICGGLYVRGPSPAKGELHKASPKIEGEGLGA